MHMARESGSTDLLTGIHANNLPLTLRAGEPYVVPSCTWGNASAILRTVSKVIFGLGMERLGVTPFYMANNAVPVC